MNGELLATLACPIDRSALHGPANDRLECVQGHTFPVVQGVPVLLRSDVPQTIGMAEESIRAARDPAPGDSLFLGTVGISDDERRMAHALHAAGNGGVDPVVSVVIAATSGYGYRRLVGKLDRYPIPDIGFEPVADGRARWLLDVGCNWGRWSISAARKGYRVVGIDPCLGAVLAADRVARSLGLPIRYVCGDARYLPFSGRSFDAVFSYSVVQHFSKPDACSAFREMARVLAHDGRCLVQMAHELGLRSMYHRMRRGFREGRQFEVRYWAIREMEAAFQGLFEKVESSAHCYFGLGLERADWNFVSPAARGLIFASESLCRLNSGFRALRYLADSIYISASEPRPAT